MRKVTFGGANSLDNFIARSDGAADWILWGEEAGEVMRDYWKNIDTVLLGRKTYEVVLKAGGGGDDGSGIKSYVFSRTLKAEEHPGINIVSSDAAAFVAELKRRDGKDICVMGGGELARSLFKADLIDEIGFNIHPILLGSGVPLFLPMSRQIDLELIECRPCKNGCVMVSYRVKH